MKIKILNSIAIKVLIFFLVFNKTFAYYDVYSQPYTFLDNNIDWELIKYDSYTVLGSSLVAMGVLYAMPESVTHWKKGEITFDGFFSKYWRNVRKGPVVDDDDLFLNYVTHPYSGALYYMAGRSAGASAPMSFLTSVIMSTFFWEYGVEAFAEVPSVQDLIITPVTGAVFGEIFYVSKRYIVNNNGKLLGSKILGKTTLIFMDPITEVANLFYEKKRNPDEISFLLPVNKNGKGGGMSLIYFRKF
ncbi:MAG: hypothetical protein Ta2D_00910 [Rickettsiales bacterium]|nr:MAG: hypothetical protein Ta2D_00910 [Rickettsiales bacterium]